MIPANCCEVTDRAFSENAARAEIRNYRRHGPARQTCELLRAVRSFGLANATLLDIGGGVGTIHHELLQDVARTALHVDASSAYLKEAKTEATRRGHADRVTFVHADFTKVAAELPQADIVTLDRVVCCYPDFRTLLEAAASKSRRLLALSYPRETWYMRLALGVVNAFQRLRRDPFRTFVHPVAEMRDTMVRMDLHPVTIRRLLVWEVAIYARS